MKRELKFHVSIDFIIHQQ